MSWTLSFEAALVIAIDLSPSIYRHRFIAIDLSPSIYRHRFHENSVGQDGHWSPKQSALWFQVIRGGEGRRSAG